MNRSLLFTGVLVFGVCASAATAGSKSSERAAERLAKFDRTGEMTKCMSTRRISSMTALDDNHFLVKVGPNKYYLNKVSRCSGAASNFNRIEYRLHGSQLCRNEIIRVVDNSSGMTVGSCGLGSFERLTKKVEEAE